MDREKKFNFLKKKLKTSTSNKEIHEEAFLEANIEFQKSLDEFMKKLSSEDYSVIKNNLDSRIKKAKNPNQCESQPTKVASNETKKIYRKVANLSHPDKIKEDSELSNKFTEAASAMSSGDYHKLYDIAEELGVDTGPPTSEQIEALEDAISKDEDRVKEIQKTVAWIWYNTPEEGRDQCMMKFLLQIKSAMF